MKIHLSVTEAREMILAGLRNQLAIPVPHDTSVEFKEVYRDGSGSGEPNVTHIEVILP